jgi:hypothetical protein
MIRMTKAWMQDNVTGEVITDHFLTEEKAEKFAKNYELELLKTETDYVDPKQPELSR